MLSASFITSIRLVGKENLEKSPRVIFALEDAQVIHFGIPAGGAALAGVSYNRFLREVQARHIVILEDSTFLDRLYELAETFENPQLQEAIRKVASSG